ncbi:Aminopeptidase Q [Ooceraea biroi]|uniref:Aminopeptidase Q n=1 Tax=Ooceraea biroi TaxID=2015173 RepID=A0A026VVH8_OOCBI|nr:Aminopeptidase Q [Ooceraea biroi]
MGIPFFQLTLSGIICINVTVHIINDKLNVNASSYQLSKTIIPQHYKISMSLLEKIGQLDLGECKIDIKISEATYNISLHSLDLDIYKEQTSLISEDGIEFKPVNHISNLTMHILNLQFDNEMQPGFYKLFIKYTVKESLREKPGFFMNKTMLMATAFQSIEARRVFPCWDEPALKVTFEINVKHHKNYKVLSNVPATSVRRDGTKENYLWTTFNITSMISTRDVAIAITDALGNSKNFDIINQWSRFDVHQYAPIQFATDTMAHISIQKRDFFDFTVDVNRFQLKQIVIPGIEHDVIGKPSLIIYK